MSDSSDERATVQEDPEGVDDPEPADGSDSGTEELTTEELRAQVEEKYDFYRHHIHTA